MDTAIVKKLNNLGVRAVHYKDTVLGNIQRGAEDPEIIAYSRIMNFVVLTRDVTKPSFEGVTRGDINGKQVQEDFSNNRVLIRNRYFRDCELGLTEIRKNTKHKVKSDSTGHNGILKYVPMDLQDSKDVERLCEKVKNDQSYVR